MSYTLTCFIFPLTALGTGSHFAELCPDCGSIRVYNVNTQKREAFWSAHRPSAMCNGPDLDSLFVMDTKGECIMILDLYFEKAYTSLGTPGPNA